jgi:ferric-dicitrate binding protein FerR (iron transport regulator)
MFTRHFSQQLAAYIDGELVQRKAQQAELHVGQCARCRAECEQVRFGMAVLEHLPLVEAPEAIWASIEAALQENRSHKRATVGRWRLAFAATVVMALAGAAYWAVMHQSGMRWEVVRLSGSPLVGSRHFGGAGQVKEGEWIETDSGSSATVKVGEIGSVEVQPNTRLRVVATRPGEHRLALLRGEIRAKISAPPRLFFVDTASGTAVDLGCEYALNTDEDGFGMLRVTKGWVSFQWNGVESLVPAGASCGTRPHAGPGIPYFDDAPENLKEALESFAFERAGSEALSTIVAESRVRDTLTLWHLLSRVAIDDRERVYERIATLTPVPAGISREQALKLDPETLNRWKEELAWTW